MQERIRLQLEFIQYARIAEAAESLLAEHGRADEIPVDVEMLVERNLGLDVVPIPGLRDLAGKAGAGSESFTDTESIYVDMWVMEHRLARYRFSLAHEVGHLVLHRHIFDAHRFRSIVEWKEFIDRVDLPGYSRMEFQAYAFAGCLLVPRKHLSEVFRARLEDIEPIVAQAKELGFDRAQYLADATAALADGLKDVFSVSADVLRRRIKKDELDELIP